MIKSSIILAALVALLAPSGARPQGVPECTCSPKAFQFIVSLDLDPLCKNNDIEGNAGITEVSTGCFIEAGVPPDSPISEGIEEVGIKDDEGNPDYEVNITSSIFKEFNEDGDIITETKQYYGSTLENGNQINLFSVSTSLDPSVSLEDQIGKVPYSVEIRLFGYNEEGQLISNIIKWSYDMSCGSDPIQTGDTIGRITIGDLIGPWPQFCPKAPSPSPSYSMSYGKASKTTTKTNKAYNSKMGNRESAD
ncbi:hypothetical protein QTG54_016627 [Skeletonema marinoi]|uniref:Uncharacterized protein n=1 Tax=Skeletonema marinoi TaxID=267567 RepID=A0AAD8XSG8_9STRA|nr:hypothetical protein QTG54_016627 [Skeletonema marinoi]